MPDSDCWIPIVKLHIWEVFLGPNENFRFFDRMASFSFFFSRFPLLNPYCKTTHLGGFLGPNENFLFLTRMASFSSKNKKVVPDFHCWILIVKLPIWDVFWAQTKIYRFLTRMASFSLFLKKPRRLCQISTVESRLWGQSSGNGDRSIWVGGWVGCRDRSEDRSPE